MSAGADKRGPSTLAEALDRLKGEQLSSVEFVHDYVQLRFDGPYLSVYVGPTIESKSRRLDWNTPGYRDELCGCIGRKLVSVSVRDEDVTLRFEHGVAIVISLRKEDRVGPEALQFVDGTGIWVA